MMELLFKAIVKNKAEIAICNFKYEYEQIYLNNNGRIYDAEIYQIKKEGLYSGKEIIDLMNDGKYVFCEVA